MTTLRAPLALFAAGAAAVCWALLRRRRERRLRDRWRRELLDPEATQRRRRAARARVEEHAREVLEELASGAGVPGGPLDPGRRARLEALVRTDAYELAEALEEFDDRAADLLLGEPRPEDLLGLRRLLSDALGEAEGR